jgi:hypothetical protein
MKDILAKAVARVEFVVAHGQRLLDPRIKIYTANTFSRSGQAGLSTVMVIVDTIMNLSDEM